MSQAMIYDNEKHGQSPHDLKITVPFHDFCYFHAKVEKKSDKAKDFIDFM